MAPFTVALFALMALRSAANCAAAATAAGSSAPLSPPVLAQPVKTNPNNSAVAIPTINNLLFAIEITLLCGFIVPPTKFCMFAVQAGNAFVAEGRVPEARLGGQKNFAFPTMLTSISCYFQVYSNQFGGHGA
ncbi:MAG: hypothetical protein LBI86_07260 [Treponema sp.]|nr:hypothetical protein [Treponema sp.]